MDKNELIEAIRRYFADTTRAREATRDGLREAWDEIETLLEALRE
jgi:hypothetical protein